MSAALQHPRDVRPVLLIDISRTIRKSGDLWSIEKTESGTVFRASVHGQQVRVLSLLSGYPQPQLAPDKGSLLYVVSSIAELQTFLDSLANPAPLNPVPQPV